MMVFTLILLSPYQAIGKMLELERRDVRVLVHWGHVHADFVKDGAALDSVVQYAPETLPHPRGSDTANEEELDQQHHRGSHDGGDGDGDNVLGSADITRNVGGMRQRLSFSGASGSYLGIRSSELFKPSRNGNKVQ